MLGTVRNVDGTNQPFTIAGLSDGSTDIVHRECNEEYQIPMAVDCQYGAGYLGITDCCKFLFNPTTGVAKVHCVETTATNVDINNNSDIGSNQPILAQGFDEDGLHDNSVEKTAVVYNANCYLCNDPTTGSPVCKPVLKATTFCADEYLGLPKDYPVKYVNALPVSPDIEDYIYNYDETKSLVGKPLKVIRDNYFGAANTKCIVLDGKTVADIGVNYTYWTDTDGNTYVSTRNSSYSNSCVVETAFKAGDAANQLLYDIGSGEGGADATVIVCPSNTNCGFPLAFYDYDNTAFFTGCDNSLTYNPASNIIESKCGSNALELKKSTATTDARVSLSGSWLQIGPRRDCYGLGVCPDCESRATLTMQADTGFGNLSCIDFRLKTSCLFNSIPFCATLNDIVSSTQDNHARFNLSGDSTCGRGSISTNSNCGHLASITSLSNYHTIGGACACNTMYAYSCLGGEVENDLVTVRGSLKSCLKQCGSNGKIYVCCDSTKGWKCLLNEDEIPTASVTVNANNDSCWYNLTGTTNNTDLIYSCANRVAADPATGRIFAAGGFTGDGTVTATPQCGNEFNLYPSSGSTMWINYRGGATDTYIGNGAGGCGNLYAANLNGTLNGCMSYGDPAVCGFRANQVSGNDAYSLTPGDWGNYLNFSHGDFTSYYGASVRVPFWDAQRFTWRVNNNGSLCPIHELLDDRGGQQINGYHKFWMGEHAGGTRVSAIRMSSTTTSAGYNGGAWIGHNNQSYDGYWGFAELGFYNAENDTLCPGLCVSRNGSVHASSFGSVSFYGNYFCGACGKLDAVTNNRVELSSAAGSGGTVIYGDNCSGYAYVTSTGLYLNAGSGIIHNQHPVTFEKSVTFEEPGVKTAMCISVSNGGDDIDFYACCNLGFTTYNCGDMNLYSDYDLCTSARCRICFEAPIVKVCNTTGDLCWESSTGCGKYQKEPNVYRDLDLNTANWGISNLATVSNRIILVNALLGSSQSVIATQNCGTISIAGSNTCWTGEVIPVGNGCEAIFNGSIRTGVLTIYGGLYLNCMSNIAAYGFGIG